jgi:hypothetical protein
MLHCGDKGWGLTTTKRHVDDYRYLAKTTSSSISISSTYIVFVTKLQKRQTPDEGFALFKNDITGSQRTV